MGLPAIAFEASVNADSAPRSAPPAEHGDFRLRALMSEADWASLPLSIRRRFSKRLAGGQSIVYAGEILESRMSHAGWWLAQAARLIGGPLPLTRDANVSGARVSSGRVSIAPVSSVHVPSVVTVTGGMGGQIWTRLYARRKSFPQVIHSSKRFAGPTGLEEYVGRGVGMALTVYAREGALIFRSENYFLQLFGRRFVLPAWLCPGTLYVTHAELPDGKFSFTLQIFHPRLGLLIRQMAMFRDVEPGQCR
jgi:Domain of unknown function (DUF4166)